MKRVAIAFALATTMLSGAALAAKVEKPDYLNDKEQYSCDDDTLTDRMQTLYNDDSPSLMKVLYVKNGKEIERSADTVKCKATIVHSRGKVSGVVSFSYEDGHALIEFIPR